MANQPLKPAFRRPEQLEWSQRYLQGLLGNEDAPKERGGGWRLSWGRMSAACNILLDKARGETEAVVAITSGWWGESLGEADGVALIDEIECGQARG